MTMRARGANAARSNAGVYSGKHGQRRLLLWSAAAVGGRRWLPATLVCGSRSPGVPRAVCFLLLSRPGAVVSPGDGRVVVVTEEENAGRPGKRVSIFLAVWNVHVNRAPAAGTITKLEYRP